jgi:thioredoxin reductase
MSVQTSAYASDALPDEIVDAVVIGGGAAGLNGALMLAHSRRSVVVIDSGTPRTALDENTRARFAARGIRVVDTPVAEVGKADDGGVAGVRLADGAFVARRVLAVATRMQARTEGLDGLKLPMEDLSDGMGRRFASGMAGTTEVPGVWVAGNATDLTAQVGAAAAAGAMDAAHINAMLVTAETDAALAAAKSGIATT